MKILFLAAIVICFIMTCLYFNKMVSYAVAMPIIVACIAIICLDKTIQAYKANNKRVFGIFGLATILCFTFVITSLLGII